MCTYIAFFLWLMTWFYLFLIRWIGCPLRKSEGMTLSVQTAGGKGTVKKLGRCQGGAGWEAGPHLRWWNSGADTSAPSSDLSLCPSWLQQFCFASHSSFSPSSLPRVFAHIFLFHKEVSPTCPDGSLQCFLQVSCQFIGGLPWLP